ncbi:mucin-2-like [Arapaima gigas]
MIVVTTSSTTSPTTSPNTTPEIKCPEWDKKQNETFLLCNCTLARCIKDNIIEIIPYECPPLEKITCANGKNPVLVYDEQYCCQHYVCDCYCEGWGDPHYITFDGLFYSFQGNCTYVLMEEKTPKYHVKIYIDNINCDPLEKVSCPRSIILSYGTQVITLKNHNVIGAIKMEAIVDGVSVSLPYNQKGVKILHTGLSLVLEIESVKAVVTFGATGFGINLPFKFFGNNTQGHCGTCNNNQADDCMLPSGQLVESCALMGDHWPVGDISKPDCKVPTTVPSLPPPEVTSKPCTPDSICKVLNSSVFAECHALISPENFHKGCVFDSCHTSNPAVECTSLQSYAAACAQVGVCIYWRNYTTKCAANCPADKVYKPCGPAEQPTCDGPEKPVSTILMEGCFCPDGTKLFSKESNICVEKCGILFHGSVWSLQFDEKFEYNCQDCVCDKVTKTVKCRPKPCAAPPVISCSEPGFIVVNETNPSDPCCFNLICRCDGSTCPDKQMSCGPGYTPQVSVAPGKCCPEHTCVLKQAAVLLTHHVPCQPHATVPIAGCQNCSCTTEVDPSSNLYQIKCAPFICSHDCKPGYEYAVLSEDECCGKCIQTHCIIELNGTAQLLKHGETWSPPDNKCKLYGCVSISGTYISTLSSIHCPPFYEDNCRPGTIQTAADGCCKVCVEKERACKVDSMKTQIFYEGCQSVDQVEMTFCQGACNTFTIKASAMTHSCTCCQESRTSNRTVSLQCLNGDMVPYTYIHVEECRCNPTRCLEVSGAQLLPFSGQEHDVPQN